MVELDELKAMHEFDDAMHEFDDARETTEDTAELSTTGTMTTDQETKEENEDSDDDFFFFDAASISSEEGDGDQPKPTETQKPDSQAKTTTAPVMERMRPSNSLVDLSSSALVATSLPVKVELPSMVVSPVRPSRRLSRSKIERLSMPPLNEHPGDDEHDNDEKGQEIPLTSTIRSLPLMHSPSSFPKSNLKRSLSQPNLKMFDPQRKPQRSAMKKTKKKATVAIADDDSDSTSKSIQRNVSFSNLEIRVYKMTLGDNPACSEGPPMTLDWEYQNESAVFDVDGYESTRGPRRQKREMCMSPNLRWWRLMRENGFSSTQIQKAVADAQKAQKMRQKTRKQIKPAAKVEAALGSAKRKVSRLFRR